MVNITPLFSTSDSIHQEYTSEQEVLIPSILSSSLFNPETDYVVFSLETINGDLLYTTQKARYVVRNVPNTITKKSTPEIITFPLEDIKNSEYSEGEYNVFYNFYRTALESDVYSFFIKEISPNRTEVRLSVNSVEDKKVEVLFNEFKTLLDDGTYFKDFYLNVGDYYYIATNTQLDTTTSPYTILFKTYQPLPSDISINSQVQVVFETAETYGFNVNIPITPITFDEEVEYIKGPNFNLGIIDEVNNSTFEQSYSSLVETPLTSSYNQIQNLLTQKGVTIDTDYTDFSNFIHFSSAQQRLLNFYYKVSLIEDYNNDIAALLTITGSTSSSIAVTSSIQSIQSQITDLIKDFDGYENFLYYTSGTYAYPKSNSTPPYTLHSTGSNDVLTWLGSTNESSNVYGGMLLSASTFDNQNQDYLYNSVPKYIKEDPINAGYELFISMVGQHFDNLYIYIDAITDRFDADNRVNYGIPKELVADALKSMGIKLYQNNFSSDDLYAAFLGINGSGNFLPPTGSEVITNYVTASNEPIPLNNLNLETYKRLYHNLPYLLKKKGTIEGLRALITCFGIPDTILRISEFGGKDKDNSNDWDYFQNKFNYALTSSILTSSWILNSNWGSNSNRPESVFFRFKPSNLPTSSEGYPLLYVSSSFPLYLNISYSGSGNLSGSYSGSIPSSSKEYATLTLLTTLSSSNTYSYSPSTITSSFFSLAGVELYNNFTASIINSSSTFPSVDTSCSISAPFYNGDWWSVGVIKSSSQYVLYASNKIYEGNDGYKIGYTLSSSLDIVSSSISGNNTLDLTPYLGIRRIITSSSPSNTPPTAYFLSLRYSSGSTSTFFVSQAKQIRFGSEEDTSPPEDFPRVPPLTIPNTGSILLYKRNDSSSFVKYSYSSSFTIGLFYKGLGAGVANEADNLSTLTIIESSSAQPFSDGDDILAVLYSGSSSTPYTLWYDSSSLLIPTQSLSVSGSWSVVSSNVTSWNGGRTLNLYSVKNLSQELRYYNIPQNKEVFYDYVMNPYSIEGSSYSSSANHLAFRVPLGSDLITTTGTRTSIHPKVTGSFITGSFTGNNSNYTIETTSIFTPQTEFIYYDQPAVGIRNRISEKIRIEDNIIPSGDTLTPYRSLQQRYPQSESYTRDVNYVEVAFSPQNEINDDINSSMGHFNIGEYIGDPRQVSESTYTYPDLDKLRDSYFSKYFKNYNWNDYIRLIKYFDNSLFKMIKDFTPARSGLATGVVIKQHLLERNRQRPAQVEISQHDYSGSVYSEWIWNDKISGSVVSESRITKINGGVGGAFDDLNNLGSSPEGQSEGVKNILAPYVTQSWTYEVDTKYGPQIVTQSTQDEFYNGELKGTEYEVTNGELGTSVIIPEDEYTITYTYSSGKGTRIFTNADQYLNTWNTLFTNTPTDFNSSVFVLTLNYNVVEIIFGYKPSLSSNSFLNQVRNASAGETFTIAFTDVGGYTPQPINVPYTFRISNITNVESGTTAGYVRIALEGTNPTPSSYIFNATSPPAYILNDVDILCRYNKIPIDVQKTYQELAYNYNNATEPRLSSIYQDIDYSNGLVPINISLLVSGTADKAPIQDSNYTSKGWTNSRYNGSRVSSTDFNV